ncbi:signal peptidase I, variant [Cryptococcus amylolentus CBS 6039]|uniref:Mitochondrial inner membrane protease subunit n=2 Tax=Cryptococcus amylolentus TaxID=104669 RepID=A0A1E3I669_9TREE|nr:signal peptidase I [Cryptococcus amylolentus CBS 6039]XP_018997924.1 signal peptidase I, variant [Cryptococcus amylolentus CBS 6039]ODN84120.1 signal peptidase I [Cryptococcus amylolentus CBS 6039]ODN84121.1 signal peptidase I, variant [Cryptococcus amylolentus CBS 6039]
MHASSMTHPKSTAMSSFARFQRTFQRFRPPPLIPTAVRTIQILATLHLVSSTLAELRICSGFSMLPTLSQHGDCVLVSPLSYWSLLSGSHKKTKPQRGDVVVATSPMNPSQAVCKRVLGVEGDLIEIEPRRGGQRKWIDAGGHGFLVDIPDEEAAMDNVLVPQRHGEGQWVKVPKGHVWLVGDNLSNSTDSRKYGPVPIAMVKGKVLARVYPNPRWITNNAKEVQAEV